MKNQINVGTYSFSIFERGNDMKTKNRIFGQNICVYMHKQNISAKKMAELLGYSENEVYQIIDSRLYVSLKEKIDIANALNVSIEDLNNPVANRPLEESGYIECRGEFSNSENFSTILNLFDCYCDVQEVLFQEREEEKI